MIYPYVCDKDRIAQDVERSIHAEPEAPLCPQCEQPMRRIYIPLKVHYNAQGFHYTDYDQYGDKLERYNREMERITGEKAPPPASDVPRNSSEPY